MSDTPDNPIPSDIAKELAEARQLLAQIKDMRLQAEVELRAASVARKKADEDALYASQAKINTEEHSKSAAIFKGSAESNSNAIATSKQNFDQLVATVNVNKATVEADMKVIDDARKTIELANTNVQATLTTGLSHLQKIQDTRTASETSQKTIDEAVAAATKAREAAGKTETDVSQFHKDATEFLATITANHRAVETSASAVAELLGSAQKEKKDLTAILERLQKSDATASSHESRVKELAAKFAELNRQAESFLPNATSTGLAHSFNAQKERFAAPQKRWLTTFQLCIVGLVLVAAPTFFVAVFGNFFGMSTKAAWDDVLLGMVIRLPIVIPLVWLAVYAGRNYMISLRLEEEYAYKEAISRAFEGYKREMKDIPAGDANNPSPLVKFCLNVLTALAERPGRIYEGKPKDLTLLSEFHGVVEQSNELRKKHILGG